jgi:hypothetical protein
VWWRGGWVGWNKHIIHISSIYNLYIIPI